MHLDISLAQCVDEAERRERVIVEAEHHTQRIAREVGQRCLKTASLNWDAFLVSADAHGALSPQIAHNALTRAAHRRRWAEQKVQRSGLAGLTRALRAAA